MRRHKEPVRKIVPKGEYVKVQAVRAGTLLWGMLLLIAGLACAAATVYLCAAITAYISGQDNDGERYAFLLATPTLFSYRLMRKFSKLGAAKIKRAGKMNNVVPLTKTTASELPAQESLVRAAAEPFVAPGTVLLRAVASSLVTPPEQLVRALNTPDGQ